MILITIVVIVSFFCHCESGMLKQSPRADSFTMEGLSQKLREITARLLQASNPRVNELTMEGYCCQFPKKNIDRYYSLTKTIPLVDGISNTGCDITRYGVDPVFSQSASTPQVSFGSSKFCAID